MIAQNIILCWQYTKASYAANRGTYSVNAHMDRIWGKVQITYLVVLYGLEYTLQVIQIKTFSNVQFNYFMHSNYVGLRWYIDLSLAELYICIFSVS